MHNLRSKYTFQQKAQGIIKVDISKILPPLNRINIKINEMPMASRSMETLNTKPQNIKYKICDKTQHFFFNHVTPENIIKTPKRIDQYFNKIKSRTFLKFFSEKPNKTVHKKLKIFSNPIIN